MKTVEEEYAFDEGELFELADTDQYWKKCAEFYEAIKSKFLMDVAPKQRAWLDKIGQSLADIAREAQYGVGGYDPEFYK